MIVETIPISDLKLDPNNARKHDKTNLEAIKGSLVAFGQQKPLVVSRGLVVVAGNGTVAAALELGWTEISVVKTGLSKRDAMAYALADNRSAELASWDDEVLNATLSELQNLDFDVGAIGFKPFDGSLDDPDGSKELDESDFSEFDNQCPKCGFEFDNKKP